MAAAKEALAAIEFEGFAQDTMIVATRRKGPDAVAAGQLGSYFGYPILLALPAELHPGTAAELQQGALARVLVIGGVEAVSDAGVEEIAALTGGAVERLGGDPHRDRRGAAGPPARPADEDPELDSYE